MVWAEVPTTPDELEMEATKSLDLKPFSHFLCFPSSVSLDSLQSPETPFTANIMMGSPETLLSPLAPYYASFSEEVKRLSNSDTKEGSVELQNGEILQVATTTNFKPVNESDKIEESVTNSIQDDFSSRISSVTAFSPSEKTLEKRTVNGEFSANNNKNNNTIVPNETPSKPKEMVYEKRYFPNNNQTSCYQKDLSIGRNLNLLNYSQIRNRNCTNILNSKDFHDNLILPQTPKEENSSNTRSNIHKNNMCNKKSTFTATVSKSQSPNRYKEDALNPFVNKGFGLDWEDGKRYQHQKLAKNFKRIGRTKSIIRKTETQDISKTRPLSKEDNIDSSEISDKHHNGARRMKKKENIKHSPNDFIFERLAVAKETKESDSINKADIKRSLLSNPKTILAKPPAETVKEETKLNSEVLKKQKNSDNRNGKNLHTATKQGSGATLHQVAAKRKPTKMRGKGGANEIKGLLTSCSVPNGIWDDKGIPWNKKREKARIRDLRAKLESFDPGFEIEKPSTDQPLGPKFFAQLCNVWPDLIARLALDINLEATSPDTPPDPPDPPNEASCAGLPYWSSSKHEINKTTSEGTTVLENKCCSSEDPSCPQLPLESIVPDTFESSKRVSLQQELSGGLKASPRREDLKKKQHILPEELEAESPNRKRHTVAIQESPRLSRKSPFDSFEMKRSSSCQSPICGSPRPKAPCPIAEISELESLESEGPDEDEEIIISTISRGGDYEEDEDLGDEGDEEEEEDEEEEDGEEGEEEEEEEQVSPEEVDDNQEGPMSKSQNERMRRRLLPEIPKNKKSFSSASILALRTPTLAEEIQEAESGVGSRSSTPEGFSLMSSHSRPILVLKCHSYIRDDTSSPETDLRLPSQDIDSGHSTQHSPDGAKSMSPQAVREISPLSPGLGVALSQLEMLDATHRGLYRFIPRHSDEVEIEIGDPIYVQKEADDLWCEGVNLRSGMQGIFPAAHVTDVDYSEFDPTVSKVKKERYLLNYLGSIETLCHKGNQVLCQAVRKIAREDGGRSSNPTSCILEVSDQGIRMVDKSRPGQHEGTLGHDYFYHLKHVSFCGFHPKDPRYFGFITKHPAVQRFACHVFESVDSTRPVAEAVGRAFHRFYKKFIETAYPTEDIYIE